MGGKEKNMNHKQKLKLARKMHGRVHVKGYGVFGTDAWDKHRKAVAKRVEREQAASHAKAVERKRKLKILDDKGKEHKVGEIFESKTMTIEI
jgi:hypothetical protein